MNPRKTLLRLILVLFITFIVDLIVISLIQNKLRFWFPQWIDSNWESNDKIIYSQSYLVGVLFIPIFFYIIDLEFFKDKESWKRIIFYSLMILIIILVLIWKLGLMIRYDKQREDLAWITFGILMWIFIALLDLIESKEEKYSESKLFWEINLLFIGILLFIIGIFNLLIHIIAIGWSNDLLIEIIALIPTSIIIITFSFYKIHKENSPKEKIES